MNSGPEHWVDATCSLEIERSEIENQAVANHRCSAKHVLLHALIKYTIQLPVQNTFSYTLYNRVVWALHTAYAWAEILAAGAATSRNRAGRASASSLFQDL